MDQLYCDGPGQYGDTCDRPVAGHGKGKCSTHLRQLSRTGSMQPIEEELTPMERTLKAIGTLAEADSDQDWETAYRTVVANLKNVSKAEFRKAIREALGFVRARGVRLGRPPKVAPELVAHLYAVTGATFVVAEMLEVTDRTVQLVLKRNSEKNRVSFAGTTRPRLPA